LLRVLLIVRRAELASVWSDAVFGFLVGATQDVGLALVLGGLLTLLSRRWPGTARRLAAVLVFLLVTISAVGTEYFAWSSHRLDAIFLAYVSEWRMIRGSVAAQVSWPFLVVHAALGVVVAAFALRSHQEITDAGALRASVRAFVGLLLLVGIAAVLPGERTWFGAVAASSPVVDFRKAVRSTSRRRAADEDLPAALAAMTAFSNPFEAKHFPGGDTPFVHTGGGTPSGLGDRRLAHPNIIVLLLEGMEAANLAAIGGHGGLTPQLDALAEQGLLFSHFFSNGTHTPRALDAILCGLYPRLLGPTTSIVQPDLPLRCLPAILGERGYATAFIHGGLIQFENRVNYLPHIGFQELRFFEQFGPETKLQNAGWGTTDADIYDHAIQWLDAKATQVPFFLTVLSISNHHPFEVPDAALATEKVKALRSNNTVRYADREAGRFIDAVRSQGLLKNTYVFILGDHGLDRTGIGSDGEAPAVLGAQLLRRTHVPLIVLGPGLPKRSVDRLASQVDLMPTVLDLLAIDAPTHAMGHSLGWTLPPYEHDLPVFLHDVYSETAATLEPSVLESYPLDEAAWERARADGQSESARWKDEGDHFTVVPAAADAVRERRVRQIVTAVDQAYAGKLWWRDPSVGANQ
jgi:arylsulfatase A-like enzyme